MSGIEIPRPSFWNCQVYGLQIQSWKLYWWKKMKSGHAGDLQLLVLWWHVRSKFIFSKEEMLLVQQLTLHSGLCFDVLTIHQCTSESILDLIHLHGLGYCYLWFFEPPILMGIGIVEHRQFCRRYISRSSTLTKKFALGHSQKMDLYATSCCCHPPNSSACARTVPANCRIWLLMQWPSRQGYPCGMFAVKYPWPKPMSMGFLEKLPSSLRHSIWLVLGDSTIICLSPKVSK